MSHVVLPLRKLRGVSEDAAVVVVALTGHHVHAQERHPRVLAVARALRPPVVPDEARFNIQNYFKTVIMSLTLSKSILMKIVFNSLLKLLHKISSLVV